MFGGAASSVISGNSLSANQFAGISISGGTGNKVTKNRIEGNRAEGIALAASDVAKVVRRIARKGLPQSGRKAAISLRLDEEVLEWFRTRGPGYQTRMNAVLRAYMEASG